MTTTMEEANAMLRQAVGQRLEATVAGRPSDQWYDPQDDEQPWKGDALIAEPKVHPTSQAFFDLLKRVEELHVEKTAQYGDTDDPFANVTASVRCGVEPWRRALCDASDCIVRLQRYAHGQPVDFDNAVMDGINWLLICWLKHNEERDG